MKRNLFEILLVLLSVASVVLSFLYTPYFLLGNIPILITSIFLLRRGVVKRGVAIQNKMEELSRGKIWSLKVKSVCPICDNDFEYDFDLGTRNVVCNKCGKKVKLIVDITPIPSEDN